MKAFTALIFIALCIPTAVLSEKADNSVRGKAAEHFKNGNFRDAYNLYRDLVVNPETDPFLVGDDLKTAVKCLKKLDRVKEADALRERAVVEHSDNWSLLAATAQSYFEALHYGGINAGVFERGYHAGGEWASSFERDRVRAMQLMEQARPVARNANDRKALAEYYNQYARFVAGNGIHAEAWRLQTLTDLSALPDYQKQWRYHHSAGSGFASVDETGNPVFHHLPETFEKAKSDGERWRWLSANAARLNRSMQTQMQWEFAEFLYRQFSVSTLKDISWFFRVPPEKSTASNATRTYSLRTLTDKETIARLANGIKRFALPDEFNHISLYKQISSSDSKRHAERSLDKLAHIFENRRQYDKAVLYWQRSIDRFGDGKLQRKRKRIDQIIGNWGRFESSAVHSADKKATVSYRFRNGKKLNLKSQKLDVQKLLQNVKEYLKSNPERLDNGKLNISRIGYRLVHKNEDEYITDEETSWSVDLSPRVGHFDKLIDIKTPLIKSGAYLLTGEMEDGNVSKIIVWIDDTVIVKKTLRNRDYLFVADAVTGKPIDHANVEFFGYKQERKEIQAGNKRRYDILTTQFAEFTNQDGELIPSPADFSDDYQWLIIATTPLEQSGERGAGSGEQGAGNGERGAGSRERGAGSGERGAREKLKLGKQKAVMPQADPPAAENWGSGERGEQSRDIENENDSGNISYERFAYLGFSRVWHGRKRHNAEYKATKVLAITDRPVYRPDQNVKFKLWIRHAGYDQGNISFFADREFKVEIRNPKGEKVFDKILKTDSYGGIESEYPLAGDAPLGTYSIRIPKYAGGTFRVEEYKKPEFEVLIESPDEQVMLGEKISATVKASYYFGAPVADAKVKIKVLRTTQNADWYPSGSWDWFYGSGYWWFSYDYNWYPGWESWGIQRPAYCWWPEPSPPPEIVAESEQAIGRDGTVKVDIDTTVAKAMHGDKDHRYEIIAEVTDASRRTIIGRDSILVARKPFKVYAWLDRGYYCIGDTIKADFSAHTVDGKPVKGSGQIMLYQINYSNGKPVETMVEEWTLPTDKNGRASLQINASKSGQFRLSYKVTDSAGHTIEGAYLFVVRGDELDTSGFKYNSIELVPDKKEYAPGETVHLLINTDNEDSTVVLFTRPANGVYQKPEIVYLKGKSKIVDIPIERRDMPNLFIEAFTINKGRIYSEMREIVVPPEKRIINVSVLPSAVEYKPGEKAAVRVELTDSKGKPVSGSIAMTVYDRSVEYISGGSNVPEIRSFFWKWRRRHRSRTESSISRIFSNILLPKAIAMSNLGLFGHLVVDEPDPETPFGGRNMLMKSRKGFRATGGGLIAEGFAESVAAPVGSAFIAMGDNGVESETDEIESAVPLADAIVRRAFADTAFWTGSLEADENGIATVDFPMPENLTGWKIRAWSVGHGTVVGEGAAEIVTAKKFMLRLQAPRFFVENDYAVLSANIHNYLKRDKTVRAILEIDGDCVDIDDDSIKEIIVKAGGEKRVDWRVKVEDDGEAVIRMKALTDEESDAMELSFPVYVHGMLKTESFCGVVRYNTNSVCIPFTVPHKRRVEQTKLEVRYSPTLAGALVDALPYMVDYPYGCTEQTLNRFLPVVIVRKVLKTLDLDMKSIAAKQTNLNPQEIGNDRKRAGQWKRHHNANPVFDEDAVEDMAKRGIKRLTAMQVYDGGWGWFSGIGEKSHPHTTAVVVHGLQMAVQNGLALTPGVLEKGTGWLRSYQAGEITKLNNAETRNTPWKTHADNLDAFIYMVLVDSGYRNDAMREYLYRDRIDLSLYAKAMLGLALHKEGHSEELEMILDNIDQYVVTDDENLTAFFNIPGNGYWWHWYGSRYEAHAYYLKLLNKVNPRGKTAAGIVKYLLNNRKNATYWNSTRDTALCIEAMGEYINACGEHKPDMTVEVLLDGRKKKMVTIKPQDLFLFDNKLIIEGRSLKRGNHTLEIRKKGYGTLFFNAYLTNFTKEDHIKKAGLEIKVQRNYYKLIPVNKTINVSGSHGQVVAQKAEKYKRVKLSNHAALKSGDLIEIELILESKNDYEYVVIEDMKAAGFEPVSIRSGYTGGGLGAYMELRDERVVFFVRQLPHGKHSVSYRMRAEIPGKFSALPVKVHAMYAPELKANSDETKLKIRD